MEEERIRELIKSTWRGLWPADKGKGKNVGVICPLCGNGGGGDGDGVRNVNGGNVLHCFKCNFSGSAFELLAAELGAPLETVTNGNRISKHTAPIRGELYKRTIEEGARRLFLTVEWDNNTGENRAVRITKPRKAAATMQAEKQDFSAYCEKMQAGLKDERAAAYLSGRGISIETAARFGVGFDSAWTNPKGGKTESARIVIPFFGGGGYFARALNNEKGCKQIGGADGVFGCVEDLSGGGVVFVCEGWADALSVIQCGFSAIAMGGNAKGAFVELAKNMGFYGHFILALDNDEGGERGRELLSSVLREEGFSFSVADICCGRKDANEALVSDADAFSFSCLEANEIGKAAAEKAACPDSIFDYVNDGGFARDTASGVCMKSGFDALDAWLDDGFFAGRLYVAAGRTGAGKSAFLWQVGENIASAGGNVLYFSLELSRAEMLARAIVRHAYKRGREIRVNSILKGAPVNDEIKEILSSVGNRLSVIDGGFGESVTKIREYVKRFRIRNKGGLCVIVDYLQAAADGDGKPENVAIFDAAKQLKQLAKDFQCVVITASSMARTAYNEVASFSSFYGSCGVEYTSDGVFALQYAVIDSFKWNNVDGRNETEKKAARAKLLDAAEDENPRKLCLIGLKNRGNNPHKRIPLQFDAAHFSMEESGAPFIGSASHNAGLSAADVESLIDL